MIPAEGTNQARCRPRRRLEVLGFVTSEREKRYQETVIGLMREYTEGIKQVQRAIEGNRERLERLEAEQGGS